MDSEKNQRGKANIFVIFCNWFAVIYSILKFIFRYPVILYLILWHATFVNAIYEYLGKDSLSYKLSSLLPGHPAVLEYSKYRRLLKQQTGDRTLRQSYDVALAKLQLAVSRRHSELRKNNEKTFLKQYAEDLMNYWGMYFYWECTYYTVESH